MTQTIIQFSISTGIALAILLIGLWLAKRIKNISMTIMEKRGLDPLLSSFSASIAHILIVVFVIIASLGQLGIQTTSLIAVLGAAGLAVGLALQGSLSNFASGVIIIALRPFKVGDFVEAGGVSGVVEGIQIFSTSMKTGDNKSIIVPNSAITGGIITNYSAKDTRRVDMVVSIGYSDDIPTAKSILQKLVDEDERILKDPAPVIAVSELADNSVNLIVRPWTSTADYWNVYWDLTEKVKMTFDKEGISIPFPQRDVHLHQVA
jgi:small conductance mechanosensitive channel